MKQIPSYSYNINLPVLNYNYFYDLCYTNSQHNGCDFKKCIEYDKETNGNFLSSFKLIKFAITIKLMVMKRIVFLCFLQFSVAAFAQDQSLDSLLERISSERNENKRIDLINAFLGSTSEIDPVLDMQNAQKILIKAQQMNDQIAEVMALTEIGYDYRAFGNTQKSLEINLKATRIAHETGNEKLVAHSELNLAHNYKDQLDFPKAIKMYLSAAETSGRLKDYLMQEWAYTSLGEIYIQMNKLDSALNYVQRAYELCMQIHHNDFSPAILQFLGSIHGKMGHSALARSYFDMAIQEAGTSKSIRWLNESYTAAALYYYESKQLDSSIYYAKKAVSIVQNTAFSNKRIKPAKLLLDLYKNVNSDSALKYSEIYRISNDSLFNVKIIQQSQLMLFENELQRQEFEKNKLAEEYQRKQHIQYVIIALGLLCFIILFLALSRSFITNTKLIAFLGVMALLFVFEFLNLILHPFLEKVTNHNPLLTLLALVCIAALLIPLHHRIEKWAIQALVEKNKKIRLANAKKTIAILENPSPHEKQR